MSSLVALLLAVFSSASTSAGFAGQLQGIAVLSLAPVDGRAVVRRADQALVVVRVGDRLSGTDVLVKQVLPDRLVLEALTNDKTRAWLYRADNRSGRSGKSRLLILDREPPPRDIVRPSTPKQDEVKPRERD